MFAGCEEKSAPQTQSNPATESPTSLAPPASPIPQVDEMQLAITFTEFADVYTKKMQASRNDSGLHSRWTVDSADIERTPFILHPYKGKIICEVEGNTKETWSTEWRYSPSFNYVDGSWMFASAKLDVTRKGSTYSESTTFMGKNLREYTLDSFNAMSELACYEIESATP